MPKVPTSQKQNRPKINPQQSKLNSDPILMQSNTRTAGPKSDEDILGIRDDQPKKSTQTNLNSSFTATPNLRHISRKGSILMQDRKQQSKNILNVINKYVTMEQLKKHQMNLHNQMKKVEQLDKSISVKSCTPQVSAHFRAANGHDLQLERIQLDPISKQMFQNSTIANQISKINDQVSKLQQILNLSYICTQKQQQRSLPNITHHTNRILLCINYFFSKLSIWHQQTFTQLQMSQNLCKQLRAELHSLHLNHGQLSKLYEQSSKKQKQLFNEMNKIRSVMQCYQKQNYQFRKQVNLLEKVIEEMNVQVQKAEKRLDDKRKQYRILEEDAKRIGIYVQQLQAQLKNDVGLKEEVRRLRQMSDHQDQQIQKWKSRCFKEQKEQTNRQMRSCE